GVTRVGGVAGTRWVTGRPGSGPVPVVQLIGRGLVGSEGRLGIFVVRPDRLDPLPPAAEGREVLAVLVRGQAGVARVGVARMVVRVVAKDLRHIVIHRYGIVSLGNHGRARRLAGFM